MLRTDKLSDVERGMGMKKRITNKVIKKIAKMEGIGEEEIRENMRMAIQRGYENPKFVNRWEGIFGKGHQPSPEEFIMKISGVLEKEKGV